jgi:Ca-activated chloride channel family protein
MVAIAQQARTSLVIAASGGVLLAALLLAPRSGPQKCALPPPSGDDGLIVTARLASTKILAGAVDQDLAVTITAPALELPTRPAASLAIVIDRSYSMRGEAIENAKAAAIELVDQLTPADAFTIITYSSTSETRVPVTLATEGARAVARAEISKIAASGGTCMSCGLTSAGNELQRSPIRDGVQRVVLISDGLANEGIWDRDELVEMATRMTEEGTSISAVGVGLAFDEVTMARIANVGHGHYSFVEDTATLPATFARELGELRALVATDVDLIVPAVPGVTFGKPYGYPWRDAGGALVVPVADLRAGETRKVVIPVRLAAGAAGSFTVANVEVAWRRTSDHTQRHTYAAATAEVVDDQAAVLASVDRDALRAISQAHASHALEQATTTFESQGYDAARRVIDQQLQDFRSNAALDSDTRAALEMTTGAALHEFAKAPAPRATKSARAQAYELAR